MRILGRFPVTQINPFPIQTSFDMPPKRKASDIAVAIDEVKEVKEVKEQLSCKQQLAISKVLEGENLFVTGGGGVGKSLVIEEMVKQLRAAGQMVAVTAMTGIAAVAISGTTLHSFAGIGLGDKTDEELRQRAKSRRLRDIWSSVDVLIIDEVSMLLPDFYVKLDSVARVARNCKDPFGGLQVVFVGDFFQLPPVTSAAVKIGKDTGEKADVPEFVFEVWGNCVESVIELDEVFRQQDPRFVDLLNRVRKGEVRMEDTQVLRSRLNAPLDCDDKILPTVLMATNARVDVINNTQLQQLPGKLHEFNAVVGTTEVQVSTASEHAMQQLEKNCPGMKKLMLKVGAQVILLANYNLSMGLANGSRGVVTGFEKADGENEFPVVRFKTVETIVVPWMWKTDLKQEQYVYFGQVPLRLAYAQTIHKSQGQSLDKVALELDRTVAECGQAYVALSRVRSLEGLTLKAFDPLCIKANPKVVKYYNSVRTESL